MRPVAETRAQVAPERPKTFHKSGVRFVYCAMKRAAQVISWLALAGTLAPPLLFFAGQMTLAHAKTCLLATATAWFIATPLWMERKPGA